jgi:hypothetical protein
MKPSLLLWLVLIFMGLPVLLYLMRNVLLKSTIEYFASEQQVQINCLDVDVNWQFDVFIHRACVTTPNFTLALQDAAWMRSSKQVLIKNVQIKQQIQTSNNKKPTTNSNTSLTELPENLPFIRIENMSIESPLLADTLDISLELQNAKRLILQGDINASLLLQNNSIDAQIEWSAYDLVHFFPAASQYVVQDPALFNDKMLQAANIKSTFSFDGRIVQSQHSIDFNEALHLPGCQLGLSLHGATSITVSEPLTAQSIELDLSSLSIGFDLSTCEQSPQFMRDWQVEKFLVSVPQLVQLSGTEITVPEINLSQVSSDSDRSAVLNMQLRNSKYAKQGQFQSDYKLDIKQNLAMHSALKGKLQVESTGALAATLANTGSVLDSKWQVTGSQNQVRLDSFSAHNFALDSAELRFTLEGDQTRGVTLNGSLIGQNAQQEQFNLAKITNQFDLEITPTFQFTLSLVDAVDAFKFDTVMVTNTSGKMQISGVFKPLADTDLISQFHTIKLSGSYNLSQLKANPLTIAKITSQFSIEGEKIAQLAFTLEHQLNGIKSPQFQLAKFNGTLEGTLQELKKLDISGQSNISAFTLNFNDKKINFAPLLLQHKASSTFTLLSTKSETGIILAQQSIAKISQNSRDITLDFELQKITEVQKIISQFLPELELTQGQINGAVQTSLKTDNLSFTALGHINVSGIGGHHGNTLFESVALTAPFKFDSAGLQLDKTTLQVGSVNAGIPIEQITATLVSEKEAYKLEKISGNILGGQFIMQNLWLDQREQMFDIVLQNLDLEKIIALQNQPGIRVTGKIMGSIPIETQGKNVNVDNGRLISQNGGRLTILHNPAFDTIKKQQAELGFLENYQFSQLSSKVTFKPDGWLFLDLAFKGQNPDKKQAVNFNYTHQENIFALLRTLRVANGIQDKIEKNITQGGKQ